MDFPTEHWTRIRTNNLTERVNREIRRRTRAIDAFPDGNSALMLVCARLRHVVASEWGSKRYMDWNIYSRWKLSSQLTRKIHTFGADDADIYWRMK